jgi:hypothetical protein
MIFRLIGTLCDFHPFVPAPAAISIVVGVLLVIFRRVSPNQKQVGRPSPSSS